MIHTSSSGIPEGMNPMLLSASVEKQAKERLEEKWRAKSFSYLANTILLAQLSEESEISELTDECDRFCRYVHRIIGGKCTVGIGRFVGEYFRIGSILYQCKRGCFLQSALWNLQSY